MEKIRIITEAYPKYKGITYTEQVQPEYVTISEIKRRHDGHWFSPDTMRFFASRAPQGGYKVGNKAYFISSEQFQLFNGERRQRAYTIRVMDWITGDIDTLGEFNKLSKSQANTALRNILKGEGYNAQ